MVDRATDDHREAHHATLPTSRNLGYQVRTDGGRDVIVSTVCAVPASEAAGEGRGHERDRHDLPAAEFCAT